MRIPLPTGWERSTKMDNESIRFAIRNPALTVDGFTPNAVVTLQKIGSEIPKPEKVLEAQNEQLVTKLKLTDVSTTPGQVCGATALSSTYTAPEVKLGPKIPPVPPRTASAVSAVYRSSEANYIATLTVQTIRPDDKTYVADSATILKGFDSLRKDVVLEASRLLGDGAVIKMRNSCRPAIDVVAERKRETLLGNVLNRLDSDGREQLTPEVRAWVEALLVERLAVGS